MNDGLSICSRYAYPPNALHLCGPEKQNNLAYYHTSSQVTSETKEILRQFNTMYPYLCLVASENRINNPFDLKVVEAYWIGNELLNSLKKTTLIHHVNDVLGIKKMLIKKEIDMLYKKIVQFGFPHHAFHVLNIYRRTGHTGDRQTLATIDACIINWGKVVFKKDSEFLVKTRGLVETERGITFGKMIERTIYHGGEADYEVKKIAVGDIVSYHWGKLCTKLTDQQLKNLAWYTNIALGGSKNIFHQRGQV